MSRVIVTKYKGTGAGKFYDEKIYRLLLDTVFKYIASVYPEKYLQQLFPGGAVGMKTNCLTVFNPTMKPLADALSQAILDMTSLKENDIIIWERTGRELKNCGYTLNISARGRRCLGTDAGGVGYSDEFYNSGSVSSLVSRVLTSMVDHSINLPVLKDHSIAGLSAGLKNMYGAVHNPNKYHGRNCDPYAAHVNNLEPIRDKHRLTVIDAVRVQYDNGPGFDNDSLEWHNGLIVSEDPVAADRIGLEIVEYLRRKNNLPPLEKVGRKVAYLDSAQELKLGISDLSLIDLKVITIDDYGNVIAEGSELF